MQYMLLIHAAEQDEPNGADRDAMLQRYFAFSQEIRDSGKYVAGGELAPVSSATTVRVRNGEALVTDGPFAETKEQLGGYYLLDCENIDEAIAYAAKIPSAERGSIEVRPLIEH